MVDMRQMRFDNIPGPPQDGVTAAPVSLVRRAVGRALALLADLARTDPATAQHVRRALMSDMGAPLTQAERLRLGNIFRASLFQRQELMLYWLPSERHITTRRTFEGTLPRRKVPANAIYIGSYRDPFPESGFLEDLDALLASIRAGEIPQQGGVE